MTSTTADALIRRCPICGAPVGACTAPGYVPPDPPRPADETEDLIRDDRHEALWDDYAPRVLTNRPARQRRTVSEE